MVPWSRLRISVVTTTVAAILGLYCSACKDTTRPRTVAQLSLTPAAETLLVGQARQFSVQALDGGGGAMEVSPAQVTWSSSNANVLSVSSDGIARAIGAGSASVRATVSSVTGQANVVVQLAILADLPTAGLGGSVTLPPGVRAEVVSVLAGAAGVASVAADGSFQIQKSTAVETALLAVQNGKLFGIAIAAAGDSGSASRVSVNAQSTALALVFLSPAFAAAPAGITRELLQLLGGVSEVGQLAQYLDGQVQTRGALPDSTDSQFVALYRSAVTAAEARLSQVAGVSSIRALVLGGMVGPVTGSGITMTPPASITPNISVQFQNAYGRDAHLYVHEADTAGRPATSLSGLTIFTALGGRLSLGAADYVPNLSSISSWVALLRGQYGAASPRSVPVTFSPQSPRYVAYAYGLGIKNWSANQSVVNGAENVRWVVPAVQTAVMSYLVPLLEILSGIEFIKPGTMSRLQTTLDVVDVIARGIQWSTCIDRQGDAVSSPALLVCTGDQVITYVRNHPEVLKELIIEIAGMAETTISSSTAEAIARNSLWPLKVLSLVSGVGRAVVTTYGVIASELRQGFDLSYNDLLGATVVAKDSGDSQQGVANGTLDHNLVVKVTTSGGAAVSAAWIRWNTDVGGGSVSQSFDTTDASGRASVRWTLGTSGTQTVSAAIAGTGRLVQFPATVVPPTVPTVTSVTPNSGPVAGGTSVTVNGANFLNVLGVTVGGNPLGNRNVVSSTRITGTTPASSPAGLKDVVVTTAGGSGTCTGCFTYVASPTVSGISPTSGPLAGGTSVTISGTNFSGVTAVTIGGTALVNRTVVSSTQITGTTPAASTAGAKDVVVTTAGGSGTCTGCFTYTAAPTWTSLTAGDSFTCGLTSGGAAYCWGRGTEGQLGNGTTTGSVIPVRVSGSRNFSTISANATYPAATQYVAGLACAISSGGATYCWGSNQFGQLGNGTTSATTAPSMVGGGLAFSSVSVAPEHACGVTTSGGAYCWGRDYYGELGNATKTGDGANPAPALVVGGLVFSAVSANGSSTCAVTTSGAAYCWGEGECGQLGNGTTLPPGGFSFSGTSTPVPVSGGLIFRSVSVSGSHACAVTTGNAAYCWGANWNGQLGTSSAIQVCPTYQGSTYPCATSPVQVSGGMRFTSISAFGSHTCGTTDTGAAYCWGYNGLGQLGDGTTTNRTSPVAVSGGLVFQAISAGADHTCGITTSGAMYCWGKNTYGQLGDGTTTQRSTPVAVLSP